MIQATVINLHPNEQRQEFHYYSFTVKLDECVGSCNTLNDLSNKVCITNKTEDLNLSMFNVITGINESKILTKHISCKCQYRFNGRKCKKIDIKNGLCYYFDDISNCTKINFTNIFYTKNSMKIFQFITFRIKIQQVPNYYLLGSIK